MHIATVGLLRLN